MVSLAARPAFSLQNLLSSIEPPAADYDGVACSITSDISSSKMESNGEAGENLHAFLESIELQQYYDAIRNELKIETVHQLKHVEEQDLEDIRMKANDIQKLKKSVKKEFPNSALGKLRKRLSRSSSESQAIRNSRSSILMDASASPPAPGKRIIPKEQITIKEDIGKGEFGIVRRAIYTNDIGQKIEVAVKSLSQDRLEHGLQEFLKEASSMQSVSHSNIVTFYGIVFHQEKELMLVTEFAPLKSLLECLHNTSLRSVLHIPCLCDFASQIAVGMTYLEAQGLIHRDLAARNILVFSHHKVKIGDFGLSRALGLGKEYYQTEYRADLKLPIAWCAPECINLLRFSSASDVWSFGVTMWELFSYGERPWAGLTSVEILQTIDVPKKERLARPTLCPTDHYKLMQRCWVHEPEDRPKFSSIVSELSSIKPTVMKALKSGLPGPGMIEFMEGDKITIIDKRPSDAPGWQFWRGVLPSGQSGLFDPKDCVPVQAESSPLLSRQPNKSPPKKSIKPNQKVDQTKPPGAKPVISAARTSSNNTRRKVTADMIGAPQNDLRHTGHIGYDGVAFGEIPFIGSEPVEKILPIKTGTTVSGHTNGATKDSVDGDLAELSDFQFPDLSLSESLDFGTSFIDEMMKEFKTDKFANKNENNNSSKTTVSNSRRGSSQNASIDADEAGYDGDMQRSRTDSNSFVADKDMLKKNPNKAKLKPLNIKTMSAADEKWLDDAIDLANKFASTTLHQANTPKDLEDEPGTPGKSKTKFSFKLPGTKKSSPRTEKRSFTDDLASKSDTTPVSPEAEQAYNMLVAKNSNKVDRSDVSSRHVREGMQSYPLSVSSKPSSDPQITLPPKRNARPNSLKYNGQTGIGTLSPERPKERPPLPPPLLLSSRISADHHDLSDLPSTPPPPIPHGAILSHKQHIEPVYNNLDPFWREEMRLEYEEDEELTTMQGKYKSRSDNVSYEDLLDFSNQRHDVRVMRQVLGSQISDEECEEALKKTEFKIHNAIKYIKLKQLVKLRLSNIEHCKTALMTCNWNVQGAADYLLDKQRVTDDIIDV